MIFDFIIPLMYFIIRYPYMNVSIFLCLTFPSLNINLSCTQNSRILWGSSMLAESIELDVG